MIKEKIFWCEFPEEVNWVKVNKDIDFKTEIYIASKNKYDFLKYKKKVTNKNIEVGVWPILDKEDGYWFSGFVSQKNIDKLDEFKEFNIKIDIEPPIFNGQWNLTKASFYFTKYFFKKSANKDYLADKIKKLKNKKIIVSPRIPRLYMKRLVGDIKGKFCYNHIFYTSMVPFIFRPLFRLFYNVWLKSGVSSKDYVALGCLGKGIYGNEGIYKNAYEFEKDLEFVKKLGFEKIVIFNLGGLFNRKDSKEFLDIIRKIK